MALTGYTVFTSFIWFNFFILLIIFLRNQGVFYRNFSIYILILLVVFCLLKLVMVAELPFIMVIHSTDIMPMLQSVFEYTFFIDFGNVSFSISVGTGLIIFSLLGSMVIACKQFLRCMKFYKVFLFLPPTFDENIYEILYFVQNMTGVDKKIKVVVHREINTPAIVGHFKPIIVLPMLEFTDEELTGVFFDELIHYKYNNIIIKFVIKFIEVLFWWNPLVHIFSKEVNNVLEFHADKKLSALLNRTEQEHYLRGIIKVIENSENNDKNELKSVSIGLIEQNNDSVTKQRFIMILEDIYSKNQRVKSLFLGFVLLLLFIFSYMFVIQPYSDVNIESYNDNAPMMDYYIIKGKDGYALYDSAGNEILTGDGEIPDNYKCFEVKEEN